MEDIVSWDCNGRSCFDEILREEILSWDCIGRGDFKGRYNIEGLLWTKLVGLSTSLASSITNSLKIDWVAR